MRWSYINNWHYKIVFEVRGAVKYLCWNEVISDYVWSICKKDAFQFPEKDFLSSYYQNYVRDSGILKVIFCKGQTEIAERIIEYKMQKYEVEHF